MDGEVNVTDGFKIVAIDDRNWQVHQFRKVKKKDGTEVEEWIALPSYHSNVEYAIKAIAKMIPKNKKTVRKDLAEFLDELDKMTKRIERAATKFDKAVKGCS